MGGCRWGSGRTVQLFVDVHLVLGKCLSFAFVPALLRQQLSATHFLHFRGSTSAVSRRAPVPDPDPCNPSHSRKRHRGNHECQHQHGENRPEKKASSLVIYLNSADKIGRLRMGRMLFRTTDYDGQRPSNKGGGTSRRPARGLTNT